MKLFLVIILVIVLEIITITLTTNFVLHRVRTCISKPLPLKYVRYMWDSYCVRASGNLYYYTSGDKLLFDEIKIH